MFLFFPLLLSQNKRNKFKRRKGICVKVNQHLYVSDFWKCSVKSQMISKHFLTRCIGTYSREEEHIPHSLDLILNRTSQTVRLRQEKQRECIHMAIRKYFPLTSIPQYFLCSKSLGNSEHHTKKQTSWYLLQIYQL